MHPSGKWQDENIQLHILLSVARRHCSINIDILSFSVLSRIYRRHTTNARYPIQHCRTVIVNGRIKKKKDYAG